MAELILNRNGPSVSAGPPRFRPRGRIVPAEEVDAWRNGQDYLHAARGEVERLRKEAHAAFVRARRQGFDEGREAGAEAAARLLARTADKSHRQLAEAEQRIVDLALSVVRRVLGAFDVDELIRQAVREALRHQHVERPLALHVAPEGVAGLRLDLDTIVPPGSRHLISVQPDPSLDRGMCRLAGGTGFVDLGIDAQLDAIRQGLIDALRKEAGSAGITNGMETS